MVNTGSSNGLLPDSTKPLPEPMLTYYQLNPVTFIWMQFHKRYLCDQPLNLVLKFLQISQGGQWVNSFKPWYMLQKVIELIIPSRWKKPNLRSYWNYSSCTLNHGNLLEQIMTPIFQSEMPKQWQGDSVVTQTRLRQCHAFSISLESNCHPQRWQPCHRPANISFQKCLMILEYNTENA